MLDLVLGDPKWLPHPVMLIGKLITFYEKTFYSQTDTKKRGIIFCALILLTVALVVFAIMAAASLIGSFARSVVSVLLLWLALACKSLKDESMAVARLLAAGNLEGARRQVARIVGRDTERLDEAGVTRAAVETIAESYVDGIVSPLFYMTLGYFCGAAPLFAWLFKAASTMDSMVGYDDERYRDFGWAAAKLDDVLNFIPARIGGLVAVAGGALIGMDWRRGLRVFLRDRLRHKSPNSAHGESAFAGLLGLRLAGGAFYGGEFEARPSLGDDLREPVPGDILSAHRILDASAALCAALIYLVTGVHW